METLLSATVGFARLLLGALFLANLGTWLFRYSGSGQLGTLFAIAAIFGAWFSQERYLLAEQHNQQRQAAGADPDGESSYMREGNIARWLVIVFAMLAFLCILLGP